ncbi:uncharacterized protein LOC124289694 [Haliotis rubra]|uniref:uncharacterized protein LOC124289694 n=1 Tax=Haliotis rubra TaxID=36100 RepID=UPI001EE595BE|nr:uncharacterized protein LOC124289694 [Haliotis rubra]
MAADTVTATEMERSETKDIEVKMEESAKCENEDKVKDISQQLQRTLDLGVNDAIGETIPDLELEGDVTYVEPVPDPYNKAIKYLEKHNILQLFQTLTTNIVYKRPEHPVDFMIDEIEELKRSIDPPKEKAAGAS